LEAAEPVAPLRPLGGEHVPREKLRRSGAQGFLDHRRPSQNSVPPGGGSRRAPSGGVLLALNSSHAHAICSLALLHSAAASMEISVLVPTRITAGPHPCRLILKNMSSEMRCAVQNSRIDIASGGPRIGGASPLACAVACGFLPVISGRTIAITPLKPDGAMNTAKPNFWHGWDAVRRDEMRRIKKRSVAVGLVARTASKRSFSRARKSRKNGLYLGENFFGVRK